MPTSPKSDQIRTLNDAFRQSFIGGQVLITTGITNMSDSDRYKVIRAVQTYATFTPDDDPHSEHDFGSFEVASETFFWKIDYYDRRYKGGSEDPSDPEQTARVLTIMRAAEY